MKILKITTFSTLSIASLAFLFPACSSTRNTTTNSSTTTTNKSNTAVIANSKQTAVSNTTPVSNTAVTSTAPTPEQSEADQIEGKLEVGKTESVILYVGMESGDYAGYCFTNDSEAGRAILAACKDEMRCAVTGIVDHEAGCKVPGLEATLSDSGKITKVESAKSLGRKK